MRSPKMPAHNEPRNRDGDFMANDVVVVLDCGATNVRAIAVDTQENRRQGVLPNATQPAAGTAPGISGHSTRSSASSRCVARRSPDELAAARHRVRRCVTVTTFWRRWRTGHARGSCFCLIISWKCPRTAAVLANIHKFDPARLQQISRRRAFHVQRSPSSSGCARIDRIFSTKPHTVHLRR